jgi:hypothetical protein
VTYEVASTLLLLASILATIRWITRDAVIHRGLDDVPLVTLPLVIQSELDAAAVERLSWELER